MMYNSDAEAIDAFSARVKELKKEVGQVIVGQNEIISNIVISIFCEGHSLLIGVPGLAKTLTVQSLAKVLDLTFNRIQFTPDLMPSDIIGSEILDDSRNFRFNRGPVFANIVLADEINRTPPKTQSALLEAMQEKSVTIAGHRHALDLPFFVLATQNPIEQEGTYPLPEAQLDRFMFSLLLDYPSAQEEVQIVKNTTSNYRYELSKKLTATEIRYFQELVRRIPVADNVVQYAVDLVGKTRPGKPGTPENITRYINWGAGPRASQFLILGAKCHAAVQGKYSPDIEDVKAIALPVLRHRVFKNYKAEAEDLSIEQILQTLL